MGHALYLEDMYLREFDATVKSIADGKFIILDRTAFYPKSGGVDHDQGTFLREKDGQKFNVVFTAKVKGEISHEVDAEGLEVGDWLHCVMDWTRRYNLMRYHTAAHVLSGLFFQAGDVKVTGNNITADQGRIDFNFPDYQPEIIDKFVNEANDVIGKDYPIETYTIPREEMDADPSLMKLAMSLPASIKSVRIVDIKGFDRQPDGGCHIKSLKEIGTIKVVKIKNKGKNNRRLYFTLE